MSDQPILVTGAAGFIGFHVARRLLAEGRAVVGLDNLNDYYEPALKRPLRMCQLGQPPKCGQLFMGAMDPFAEQPRLEPRSDFSKIRPRMGSALHKCPREPLARIVYSLGKRGEQVCRFGPAASHLFKPFR